MINNPDEIVELLKKEIAELNKILYIIVKSFGGVHILNKVDLVSCPHKCGIDIIEDTVQLKLILTARKEK